MPWILPSIHARLTHSVKLIHRSISRSTMNRFQYRENFSVVWWSHFYWFSIFSKDLCFINAFSLSLQFEMFVCRIFVTWFFPIFETFSDTETGSTAWSNYWIRHCMLYTVQCTQYLYCEFMWWTFPNGSWSIYSISISIDIFKWLTFILNLLFFSIFCLMPLHLLRIPLNLRMSSFNLQLYRYNVPIITVDTHRHCSPYMRVYSTKQLIWVM